MTENVSLLIWLIIGLVCCYLAMLKPRKPRIGSHYADLQKRALQHKKGRKL